MSTGSYKYLFKNIGLLTISNFTSKILTFLLVPLYTSVLTTAEYGTYDFYITTILLLTPLFSVNIVEGVLRFLLDKTYKVEKILTIGIKIDIVAIVLCSILVIINYEFNIISILNEYPVIFIMYFISLLWSDLMNQFARGIDKVKVVAIAGILNSVTHIGFNIVFLLFWDLGISGFFYASILSLIISGLYVFIELKCWNFIKLTKNDNHLLHEMVSYSFPLVFSNLSGWVNNLSSRYVVIWLCGASINGIFSVATKIPAILLVFQTIFSQAWTLSAVRTLDEGDYDFCKSVYRNYNFGMVIICSIVILFNKLISGILFGKAFYDAWQFAPFLLVSVVFSSLTGFLVGMFAAFKKSKSLATTMSIGAMINIVLCIVLVFLIGPLGAAIASMVSYIVVWVLQLNKISEYVDLRHGLLRDCVVYFLLLVQAVSMLLISDNTFLYSIEMSCVILILLINIGVLKSYLNKLKMLICKRFVI